MNVNVFHVAMAPSVSILLGPTIVCALSASKGLTVELVRVIYLLVISYTL